MALSLVLQECVLVLLWSTKHCLVYTLLYHNFKYLTDYLIW